MTTRRGRTRIAVVGAWPLLRRGIIDLISRDLGYRVCTEATNPGQALNAVNDEGPDAVVLDLSMDGLSGLEVLRSMHQSSPRVPILVVAPYRSGALAARVLQAGATGYVTQHDTAEDVARAIETVLEGARYVPEELKSTMVDHLLQGRAGADPAADLSDRELEVFHLLGRGRSSSRIAKSLGISEKTVHTHRESIKRKLGLESASELVHAATLWLSELSGGL